jgi:hypothetical protein
VPVALQEGGGEGRGVSRTIDQKSTSDVGHRRNPGYKLIVVMVRDDREMGGREDKLPDTRETVGGRGGERR